MDHDPDHKSCRFVPACEHVDVVSDAAEELEADNGPHEHYRPLRAPGGHEQRRTDSADLEPEQDPGIHEELGRPVPGRDRSKGTRRCQDLNRQKDDGGVVGETVAYNTRGSEGPFACCSGKRVAPFFATWES